MALAGLAAGPALVRAEPFQDPLDFPAQMRSALATRPLLAIAHAGDDLVAVGSRGLIVRSADQGKTWTQSAVPVQSDLLAVHFPTAKDGWAVGHDGVILHSRDGGRTWTKQLDGRQAAIAFKKFYAEAGRGTAASIAASQIEQNFKAGPALPWLDVWFEDARRGFVVGSFGMIAATVDGGNTWEPWLHRIDNNKGLNLNAIRNVGGSIYIAGEHGAMFKLDGASGKFVKRTTGYAGSFFGMVGNSDVLLTFGLHGVVYRTADAGTTWEALAMPVDVAVTAGAFDPGSSTFLLVNSAGQFLQADAQGRSFRLLRAGEPLRYTAVALVRQGAVATGLNGVRNEPISGDSR